MFYDVERPLKSIFYILHVQKSDLCEVAEVMFYIGERALKLIICLLDVLKNYFVEVDEAMFQCVKRP
jgi:hypothetical protein